MKALRISAVTAVSLGLLGALAVGSASASGHSHKPAKGAKVVVGTICSYTAGSSVTISQSCGGSGDVTVSLNSHSKLAYVGATSPAPAPVAGDAAAASLRWHKGHAIVKKLRYSETAFGFAHHQFPGTFVSSTGDCTSGTLTIMGMGKKGAASTFNTNTDTVYKNADGASDCATVSAAYAPKERINVRGIQSTDLSWFAAVVNANPSA